MKISLAQKKSKIFAPADYNPLRSGDVVRIRVPKAVSPDREDDDEAKGSRWVPAAHGIPAYIHFTINIPGGVVSCHVHGDVTMDLAGRLIDAEATIIEKTLADERKVVIVDLYPVEWTKDAKARLVATRHEEFDDSLWSSKLPQGIESHLHVVKPGGKLPPM